MGRNDNRYQSCRANPSEAWRRLQDPDNGVLLPLSKQIDLCLLLLLQQEVEVIVEPGRPRLRTGTQLLLPVGPVTGTVNVLA